jgi:hypothetical protein
MVVPLDGNAGIFGFLIPICHQDTPCGGLLAELQRANPWESYGFQMERSREIDAATDQAT